MISKYGKKEHNNHHNHNNDKTTTKQRQTTTTTQNNHHQRPAPSAVHNLKRNGLISMAIFFCQAEPPSSQIQKPEAYWPEDQQIYRFQ